MKRTKRAVFTLAAAVTLASCSGTSRQDTLAALADTAIIPTYEQLAIDSQRLSDAATDFCRASDEVTLAAVNAELANTRASWSISEAFWIGPVMERRSWAVVDWPVDADDIESLISEDGVLSAERLATRVGADQRGLGAIEYVLSGSFEDPRRCEYLVSIAQVVATEAALIPADWTNSFDGGEAYRITFANNESSELDDLVNDIVFLLEAMTDAELGAALGEMNRAVNVDAIVEGPAALGAADLQHHLYGLRSVLVGSDGNSGLSPLFTGQLTGSLTDALDDADAAIEAVEGPLREAAADRSVEALAARNALKNLQILVNTEVVSTLGVTIGFSDADGDTG